MALNTAEFLLELQRLCTLAQRRANVLELECKDEQDNKLWSAKKTEFFLNSELAPHVNYILRYVAFYDCTENINKVQL